jgi:hypothetical protein
VEVPELNLQGTKVTDVSCLCKVLYLNIGLTEVSDVSGLSSVLRLNVVCCWNLKSVCTLKSHLEKLVYVKGKVEDVKLLSESGVLLCGVSCNEESKWIVKAFEGKNESVMESVFGKGLRVDSVEEVGMKCVMRKVYGGLRLLEWDAS